MQPIINPLTQWLLHTHGERVAQVTLGFRNTTRITTVLLNQRPVVFLPPPVHHSFIEMWHFPLSIGATIFPVNLHKTSSIIRFLVGKVQSSASSGEGKSLFPKMSGTGHQL
tara:strand:+ start:235 stop:567 length:333 start_codon:yes stop_codon:yes gene_type:complete